MTDLIPAETGRNACRRGVDNRDRKGERPIQFQDYSL